MLLVDSSVDRSAQYGGCCCCCRCRRCCLCWSLGARMMYDSRCADAAFALLLLFGSSGLRIIVLPNGDATHTHARTHTHTRGIFASSVGSLSVGLAGRSANILSMMAVGSPQWIIASVQASLPGSYPHILRCFIVHWFSHICVCGGVLPQHQP